MERIERYLKTFTHSWQETLYVCVLYVISVLIVMDIRRHTAVIWYTPKSAYTKAYEEHILLKLVNSTVQDVCLKEALVMKRSWDIDRHIQGEVDWNQFTRLDILG